MIYPFIQSEKNIIIEQYVVVSHGQVIQGVLNATLKKWICG